MVGLMVGDRCLGNIGTVIHRELGILKVFKQDNSLF